MTPSDELSKAEIRKDAVQDTVEATATAVGTVTTIVTTAVRDVARTVGGLATEVFEIRDAVRRARAEQVVEDRPDGPVDG
ncbi:MAG TPA: hypothetical protein VFQ19_13375 [Nocardioidaceae bacterium]|nr:hypothetical protein [Nocardioidaceae bacterium]